MQNNETNPLFDLADNCVNFTGRHLFLTGKAGTGKTTFLHHIKAKTDKNAVVVAPTGVAAINAKGVTMHSFFQLPFTPFLPDASAQLMENGDYIAHNKHTLFVKLRFNKAKRKLINELELLIIDEVSMLRADMLDAIDAILRHFRRKPEIPFGGVQVLFIGDLYQLPPVVVNHEWRVLKNFYPSPFFFHAKVLQEAPPLCIELKKIYRQKDEDFIKLLNKIRHANLSYDEMQELNSYYKPDFKPKDDEQYITLCSHNYKAKNINDSELGKLSGTLHKFSAEVEGDFNENAFPAEQILELKEGAQIMFIKNDKGEEKRYYNGKIGKIKTIFDRKITVEFPEEKESLLLEKEEWKNIRYQYNASNKRLDEEEIGAFRQYPIRLAWAVTIHKSQGLTFDRAVIDAGSSFSAGQVYVALSRMSSTNGLVLRSVIKENSIRCDDRVLDFMDANEIEESELREIISKEQQSFILRCINQSFDWQKLNFEFKEFAESHPSKKIPHQEEAEELIFDLSQKIEEQKVPADNFRIQLQQIVRSGDGAFQKLEERIKAARDYFKPRLLEIIQSLKGQTEKYKKERRVKKYLKELHELTIECEHKITEIEQSVTLAEGLAKGENQLKLLEKRSEEQKNKNYTAPPEITKGKAKKGESQRLSLEYYKEGKKPEEIAEARGMAVGTVESHLISFVKTGDLPVSEFVENDKVEKILQAIETGEEKLSELKSKLPEDFTYNEIKATWNHWYNLKLEKEV